MQAELVEEQQYNMRQWLRDNLKGDPIIWFVVGALSLISIAAVYSATGNLAYRKADGNTEFFLLKHTSIMAAALVLMWLVHNVPYRYFPRLFQIGLVASIPLLLLARITGTAVNEASRWLNIPIINQGFQPSDLAKVSLIGVVSFLLSKHQHTTSKDVKDHFPMFAWIYGIFGLVALTNNSTALMLLATSVLLMFIGRVKFKFITWFLGVGIVLGILANVVGQRGGTAQNRIKSFFTEKEIPYQAQQSYIAIARGEWFGEGPGNSHQKNLIPHPYNDFIYAIIIEEYGMFGGTVVLLLFLVLLYRGMVTVANSKNPFGGLLAAGLSFSIAIQAIINMAVAVGLFPITGQPLPWVSMGGTSLLFTGITFGIILSVSRGDQAALSESKQVRNVVKRTAV